MPKVDINAIIASTRTARQFCQYHKVSAYDVIDAIKVEVVNARRYQAEKSLKTQTEMQISIETLKSSNNTLVKENAELRDELQKVRVAFRNDQLNLEQSEKDINFLRRIIERLIK